MQQRGRKSAANLASLNVDGSPPRLHPPSGMTDDERALFVKLTGACGPRHFVEADAPLLLSYVQATLMARCMAYNPGKVAI